MLELDLWVNKLTHSSTNEEEENAATTTTTTIISSSTSSSISNNNNNNSKKDTNNHNIQTTTTTTTTTTTSSIPSDVFRAAYRFDTPCLCRHTTVQNRTVNCIASPWCFAGFHTLSNENEAIKDCIADIVGEGPQVLMLPGDDYYYGGEEEEEVEKEDEKDNNNNNNNNNEDEERDKKVMAGGIVNTTCTSTSTNSNSVISRNKIVPIRRGIRNLGNTCYFNAVLQLLFNIPSVRNEVLSLYKDVVTSSSSENDQHHNNNNNNNNKNNNNHTINEMQEKNHTSKETSLRASGLGELFAEMAFTLDGCGANAQPFASFLSLDTQIQQDAQEFFALLIEWLQREGSRAVGRIFEGALLYDRACWNCKRSFKRAEPFSFLSLPVKSSLEESLNTFLQPEEVEGFVCEGCNSTTTVSLSPYMRALPDVLVIHLNRFTFDVQTLQRQKVTKSVNFPLEWDLTEYMNQWKRQQREKQQDDNEGNSTIGQNASSSDAVYTLNGIINHLGETALCGHYTFYGKIDENGGWYQFDDGEVTKLQHRFQGTRGSSKEVYMLVYKKRQTSVGDNNNKVVGNVQECYVDPKSMGTGRDIYPTMMQQLPPPLFKHIQRLNHELISARQTWELRRSEVMSFMQQWSEIIRELFAGFSLGNTRPLSETLVKNDVDDYFALPSNWLLLLGRCFLPSHVNVRRYGDGDKRKKRLRSTGISGGGAGDIINSNNTINTMESVNNEFSVPTVISGADGSEIVYVQANADVMNDGTPGYILFEGVHHAATLLNKMCDARCPHNKLAPWGNYKLVPSSTVMKLVLLLKGTSTLLESSSFAAGVDNDTNSNNNNGVNYGPFARWRVRDHICDTCAVFMANKVLKQKELWDEESAALTLLSSTSKGTTNSNNSNNNNSGESVKDAYVYVSESVIECWEDSRMSSTKWKDVVNHQGFTGLFTLSQLQKEEKEQKQQQWECDNVSTSILPIPDVGKLLCEHGLLAPSAAVRIVPVDLWFYLRERVLRPLFSDHNNNNRYNNNNNNNNNNSSNSDDNWIEQILPYLPTHTTLKCPDCIQQSVTTTSERHRIKVAKMEERKRFGTIATASQLLSASLADMLSQHPNRTVWKRNLERSLRDHRRSWEKDRDAAIAALKETIEILKKEEEERKREQAAWNAMKVRRGNKKRNTNRSTESLPTGEIPSTSLTPTTDTINNNNTNTTTNTSNSNSVNSNSVPLSPLQLAEEALNSKLTETIPELTTVYGCVPLWWITAWRQWCADVEGVVRRPPRFNHNIFRCPHGGVILPSHLMNSTDPFWEAKSTAKHLWQILHRRSVHLSTNNNNNNNNNSSSASGAVNMNNNYTNNNNNNDYDDDVVFVSGDNDDMITENSDLPGIPPLVLVPMDEFMSILKDYGDADMLLPLEDKVENAERAINREKVVLFVERNTERMFDPPSCEECVAALLDSVTESSRCFMNGSLKLQLHLRRSKKNFYDANDILHGVHHSTTLRELKLAIARQVADTHKFILPIDEMEILRGRKPLRRNRDRPHSNNINSNNNNNNNNNNKKEVCTNDVHTSQRVVFDVDADPTTPSSSQAQTVNDNEMECTLFECGLCDGDVITVNATDRVLAKIANVVDEIEVWEEIPPELLQQIPENPTAFASTRLYGAVGEEKKRSEIEKEGNTTATKTTEFQLACEVCTFINTPGSVCCEICETPLKKLC